MKGLSFSGPMVIAWMAGRKTVTRRLIKPAFVPLLEKSCLVNGYPAIHLLDFDIKTPYETGERVYIKEIWAYHADEGGNVGAKIFYRADGDDGKGDPHINVWRSPRFMPEWAARSHARIVSVRPERVQEITEEEAVKEGFIPGSDAGFEITAADRFLGTWEHLYPGSWNRNDWVWRIELEKLQ